MKIKKDSCMSRMGIPDYVIFMRKPGENPERVTHTNESFPVSDWQEYASPIWDELNSPVWWDINQTDTLNAVFADEEAERHICPLQLPVIERVIRMYSNEGDLVFTPFLGIGSECKEAEHGCKDEPTISKMEQVDKDTNVRSKYDCKTCKHDLWHTPRMCGKCVRQEDGKPSMYEPKTEPQTERSNE